MTYNSYGESLSDSNENIYIKDIRTKQNITDDDLLQKAINLAKERGGSCKIIWDGKDIHFSGRITHECCGFAGINFNGSKIYMPEYDGIILDIIPDEYSELNAPYSDFTEAYTTNELLKDKVFTMNTALSGNADMCIGYRNSDSSEVTLYYSPAIKTQKDGKYETGDLYLTPKSGNIICYNIHNYPVITFELQNGVIISNASSVMCTLARCTRSNTRISNFILYGQSIKKDFHWGIFKVENCVSIEVSNLSGENPHPRDGGGYTLSLLSVSFSYVHDIHVGDSNSWGCFGNRLLTNAVYERCYSNRWDCHFAQFGNIAIRNCVTGKINYGIGNGMISISDCIIKAERTTASEPFIEMRGDCSGVFDGDICVSNCVFQLGEQLPENMVIWKDGSVLKKTNNSKVSGTPFAIRELRHCKFPDTIKSLFGVQVHFDDKEMYKNISYVVKESAINCLDSMIYSENNGVEIRKFAVKACDILGQNYLTKTLLNCDILITNSDTCGNDICIVSNIRCIFLEGCKIKSLVSDSQSNELVALGNAISGTQSVSNFIRYALSGNIASDMEAVNKHS